MRRRSEFLHLLVVVLMAMALIATGCSGSSDDEENNPNGDADTTELSENTETGAESDGDLSENEGVEVEEDGDVSEGEGVEEENVDVEESVSDGDVIEGIEEEETEEYVEEEGGEQEVVDGDVEVEPEQEMEANVVDSLPADIPDADENGIFYAFDVSVPCAHEKIRSSLSIDFVITVTHPEIGDLSIYLFTPSHQMITVYDQTDSGNGGTFYFTYNGNIDNVDEVEGRWMVKVVDHALSETGTLDSVEYDPACNLPVDGDEDSSEDVEIESSDEDNVPGLPYDLIVYTTDFTNGGQLIGFQFNEGVPQPATIINDSLHTDVALNAVGYTGLVIERMGADRVLMYTGFENGTPVQSLSVSVGNGDLNAQDAILATDSKLYVTRYASNEILILNANDGSTLGTIDISAFADDADDLAEPSRMIKVGDIVFVQVQALDSNNYFAPYGTSWLLLIDTRTDSLIDLDADLPGVQGIRLPQKNPFGKMYVYDGKLYVNLANNAYSADGENAGIWSIDLSDFSVASAPVISEDAVGGSITAFTIGPNGKGLAVVATPSFTTKVVGFDLNDGTVESTPIYDASAWDVNDVAFVFDNFVVATSNGIKAYDLDFVEDPDGYFTPQLPSGSMPPVELQAFDMNYGSCIDDNTCTGGAFCDMGRCMLP